MLWIGSGPVRLQANVHSFALVLFLKCLVWLLPTFCELRNLGMHDLATKAEAWSAAPETESSMSALSCFPTDQRHLRETALTVLSGTSKYRPSALNLAFPKLCRVDSFVAEWKHDLHLRVYRKFIGEDTLKEAFKGDMRRQIMNTSSRTQERRDNNVESSRLTSRPNLFSHDFEKEDLVWISCRQDAQNVCPGWTGWTVCTLNLDEGGK